MFTGHIIMFYICCGISMAVCVAMFIRAYHHRKSIDLRILNSCHVVFLWQILQVINLILIWQSRYENSGFAHKALVVISLPSVFVCMTAITSPPVSTLMHLRDIRREERRFDNNTFIDLLLLYFALIPNVFTVMMLLDNWYTMAIIEGGIWGMFGELSQRVLVTRS